MGEGIEGRGRKKGKLIRLGKKINLLTNKNVVFSIPIFIFTVFNFTPLQLVTGVFFGGGSFIYYY